MTTVCPTKNRVKATNSLPSSNTRTQTVNRRERRGAKLRAGDVARMLRCIHAVTTCRSRGRASALPQAQKRLEGHEGDADYCLPKDRTRVVNIARECHRPQMHLCPISPVPTIPKHKSSPPICWCSSKYPKCGEWCVTAWSEEMECEGSHLRKFRFLPTLWIE